MNLQKIINKTIAVLAFVIISMLVINPQFVEAGTAPGIQLQQHITGLSSPIGVFNAGDSSGRLFVIQRTGEIRIFDGTQLLATPFLDIPDSDITAGGERGLLGLVFHPDYETNGFFYINYTDENGDTVVERRSVSASDPNVADTDASTIVQIIGVDQPASNHNAGQLKFGPDNYLYISMGDGGVSSHGQNLQTILGNMLRVDVDGDDFPTDDMRNYAIPASNPYIGSPNDPNNEIPDEIWSSGFRNPWRFSFDRSTGDMYIADVGQNNWEEVNFQEVASTGMENYGWRCYEGNAEFNTTGCQDASNYVFPISVYSHSLGCSITGGYVYRGTEVAGLQGYYLYADFCSGRIWAVIQDSPGSWTNELLLDTSV